MLSATPVQSPKAKAKLIKPGLKVKKIEKALDSEKTDNNPKRGKKKQYQSNNHTRKATFDTSALRQEVTNNDRRYRKVGMPQTAPSSPKRGMRNIFTVGLAETQKPKRLRVERSSLSIIDEQNMA